MASIARAVTITHSFVKDNRELLTEDLKKLNRTLGAVAREREALKTTLEVAPLGMSNLALSWDVTSAGAGIRLQITPALSDLGNVLCALVTNAGVPDPTTLCTLFKAIAPALPPIDQNLPINNIPGVGAAAAPAGPPAAPVAQQPKPTVIDSLPVGKAGLMDQIQKLLAGAP